MKRLVRVEFGPSRSKRFRQAVAEARSGVGECSELEPDRYRASFVRGEDPDAYSGLARMLERVRRWRATDVYEDDELVSAFHAKDIQLPECPKARRLAARRHADHTLAGLCASGGRYR